MPKRSGSNKLKKARSGGPRRARLEAAGPLPVKLSGPASARRDPRDDETRPERRPRIDDRPSSPAAESQPASTRPLSLMERFQALPDTSRYGVIFAVVAVVGAILYFAFSGGSTPPLTTTQPTSSQIPVAPSGPSLLPSAMMVPATGPSGPSLLPAAAPVATPAIPLTAEPAADTKNAKAPAAVEPAPQPKAPAAVQQAPQPKAPAAAQPPAAQPPPKAPAPVAPRPAPGGDNPY